MSGPFTPVTTEPFPLFTHEGVRFEVVPSNKSAFRGFELYTNLPCLHLSVSAAKDPGKEMPTWETWDQSGARIVVVQGAVRGNFDRIVRHFFGDALSPSDATWGDGIRSRHAARRPHPHFQFYVGHKDLWPGQNEESALIARNVDSILAPKWIVRGVIEKIGETLDLDDVVSWLNGSEDARERVIAMLMTELRLDRPDKK